MKKSAVGIAVILSLMLVTSTICSCSKELEDTESTQAELIEETVEETSFEEPANTSAPDEAPEATSSLITTSINYLSDEDIYNLFVNYANFIYSQNPDGNLRFNYSTDYTDGNIYPTLQIGYAGASTCQKYIIDNGEVVFYQEGPFNGIHFTYEEFIQLPIMIDMLFSTRPIDNIRLETTVPDGTYYGDISAISLDGSMALITVGDPVIITTETYDSLEPGDHLPMLDDNPFYDLTVLDNYGEEGVLMFGDLYFIEQADGTYILKGDSDYTPIYNERFLLINIAPDCHIEDTFIWLYGPHEGDISNIDISVFPYSDGPNNLSNTTYFHSMTDSDFNTSYNGWIECYGILEPVVISNNTIVNLRLGWR